MDRDDRTPAPLRALGLWGAASTAAIELVTVVVRAVSGTSAAAFNESHELPWLLAMHHMFWGVPFALAGLALAKTSRTWSMRLFGLAIGLLLSDLMHHFVVLPLWVGNTGWHWP